MRIGIPRETKIKEPTPEEHRFLRADLVLFAYLHLAAAPGLKLADLGVEAALASVPELRTGLNTWRGQATYRAVAEAHGLSFHPVAFDP